METHMYRCIDFCFPTHPFQIRHEGSGFQVLRVGVTEIPSLTMPVYSSV